MLISKKYKFIFIANSKAASTTIESMLLKYSDIIVRCAPEKHMIYSLLLQRFEFLFEQVNIDKFYKFGVFRDPVDWCISWYNFRSREDLKLSNSKNYTGDISFQDYVDLLTDSRNPPSFAQIGFQKDFFIDVDSNNGMDYIIDFDNLQSEIHQVLHGLKIELKDFNFNTVHKNKSTPKVTRESISETLISQLKEHFREDYEFLENFRRSQKTPTSIPAENS